jgi:hypothetical protein
MAVYVRDCDCTHEYPLCPCREGIHGKIKRLRARKLSRLAGWSKKSPQVTVEAALATIALHGWPERVEAPAVFQARLPTIAEAKAIIAERKKKAGPCVGCGGGRA